MILTSSFLYTAEQVKQGERLAAKLAGIEMYVLMQRAGGAVFRAVQQTYPNCENVIVLCGGGNNGGDGFIVAKLAKQYGLSVALYLSCDESKLRGDAKRAKDQWLECGGEISSIGQLNLTTQSSNSIIIDALLGTGLKGEVRASVKNVVGLVNQSTFPKVSIDIPSGLCSDTGAILGNAIRANLTVTFIGIKQGLVTGKARDVVGTLIYDGLQVEREFYSVQEPTARLLDANDLELPIRAQTAHKGNHGRLLCLGGNQGYAGAIRLCASAAARNGAGLITTLCHASSVLPLQVAYPEVMTREWQAGSDILEGKLLEADVIALGPGLGTNQWADLMYQNVVKSSKPKVLDADALTMLAQEPFVDPNRVITPHPGEAARLLDCTVSDIENDRFNAVKRIQAKYGGVVVLKGAGTLIYDGREVSVCDAGNPGMASGGMGDVLTGMIAAFLAQGLPPVDASKLGVLLHSVAADSLADQYGQIGLLASDIVEESRRVLSQWCKERLDKK
ncbi:NAD(P)H-hydrate dehydratase [Vibrio aquaticus]|uniref:Bifunctional NAD(P)H-hydrate repair enzyme n=1 Tax=Vibrio aquaticus TaxID=2496559 RepID=A0A432D115_9VIBR|nr:NAD(P)H-hydrate dehydratase [Vibrio aquaticus]RTZ17604.1 NAD(P)H-hydrate dehydratase [Vibrio aquaticus]